MEITLAGSVSRADFCLRSDVSRGVQAISIKRLALSSASTPAARYRSLFLNASYCCQPSRHSTLGLRSYNATPPIISRVGVCGSGRLHLLFAQSALSTWAAQLLCCRPLYLSCRRLCRSTPPSAVRPVGAQHSGHAASMLSMPSVSRVGVSVDRRLQLLRAQSALSTRAAQLLCCHALCVSCRRLC